MSETLTAEKFNAAMTAAFGRLSPTTPPARLYVLDFKEQWRVPRSKKRRMRKKWAKNPANWRSKPGQLFRMNLPEWLGGGFGFVMSPDMHERVRSELRHVSRRIGDPVPDVADAAAPTSLDNPSAQ